jgi:hypothetical protein
MYYICYTERKHIEYTMHTHIALENHFGATYYRKICKSQESPQKHMLNAMANNTLAITYQPSEKDRWFASYPSIHDFIGMYSLLRQEQRQFYEILYGAVHTYADLDWKGARDEDVIMAFTKLWNTASVQLGIAGGQVIWSISSKESKGSLHFKYELDGWCWRNVGAKVLLEMCCKVL